MLTSIFEDRKGPLGSSMSSRLVLVPTTAATFLRSSVNTKESKKWTRYETAERKYASKFHESKFFRSLFFSGALDHIRPDQRCIYEPTHGRARDLDQGPEEAWTSHSEPSGQSKCLQFGIEISPDY